MWVSGAARRRDSIRCRSVYLRLPLPSFPDGLRGFALLWLRVAAALALAQGAAELLDRHREWSSVGAASVALFVAIGFLTPAFALLAGLVEMTWMIVHPVDVGWSAFLLASILVALAVLGPGAYSIDRWLFGRKRLTIGRSPN